MPAVKKATTEQALKAILQLRYKMLRQPWGQSFESATDHLEQSSLNAYMADETGLTIACGRLQENENRTGQIRFMAVDANYQGKGFGKSILLFLEDEARISGLQTIELQARENALDFYKKNGYTVKEKSFLLWGLIQHYLMVKTL